MLQSSANCAQAHICTIFLKKFLLTSSKYSIQDGSNQMQ